MNGCYPLHSRSPPSVLARLNCSGFDEHLISNGNLNGRQPKERERISIGFSSTRLKRRDSNAQKKNIPCAAFFPADILTNNEITQAHSLCVSQISLCLHFARTEKPINTIQCTKFVIRSNKGSAQYRRIHSTYTQTYTHRKKNIVQRARSEN